MRVGRDVCVTMTRTDHHTGRRVEGPVVALLVPDEDGGLCEVRTTQDPCAMVVQTPESARVCFLGVDGVEG